MQKIYFSFILVASLLAASLLFTSCSKDDPKPSDSLSAKVDGTAFTSATIVGIKMQGVITINANPSSANKAITLGIKDNVVVGKYDISDMLGAYYAAYANSSITYSSISGNLEITKHDINAKRIEGKFSFKAEDFNESIVDVTEGSFAVTYTQY